MPIRPTTIASLILVGVFAACGGTYTGDDPDDAGGTRRRGDPATADAGLAPRKDASSPEPEKPEASTPDAAGELQFDLLQANVGNASADCYSYQFKLCSVQVERRIAANLQARAPQVLSLEELVPDTMCAGSTETNTDRVCHPSNLAAEPNQARRLVGPGYSVGCDARRGFDCLAVATSFGSIRGCAAGSLCYGLGNTLPMDAGCDDGFSMAAYVVEPLQGAAFTVIVGHPPSGTARACRASQIRATFTDLVPGDGPVVVAGDLNLDPYRQDDESVLAFREFVGDARPFKLLSGLAEASPPLFTSFAITGNQTYDHVLSNRMQGTCKTLGEAPGTQRLDGDSGCDHRAEACALRLP